MNVGQAGRVFIPAGGGGGTTTARSMRLTLRASARFRTGYRGRQSSTFAKYGRQAPSPVTPNTSNVASSISILPGIITIDYNNLPPGANNATVLFTITVGGNPPPNFTQSAIVPSISGLVVRTDRGGNGNRRDWRVDFTGSPAANSTHKITFTTVNGVGSGGAQATLTIRIIPPTVSGGTQSSGQKP